ncbi:MAG: divergent polysaccharide deacetylase family protein [Hyphomicrobiales bacterium]
MGFDYDELTKPLERRRFTDRLRVKKLTLLTATVYLSVGALGCLLIWLSMMSNPVGDQPVAKIAIAPAEQSDELVTRTTALDLARGKIRVLGGDEPEEMDAGIAPEPAVSEATRRAEDAMAAMRSSGRLVTVPGGDDVAYSPIDEQFGADPGFVPDGATEDENVVTGSILSAAKTIRLAEAPARGLVEKTPYGPLPKISDGRIAAKVYARPVDRGELRDLRGRIAIVVGGMGLSAQMTKRAINDLPGEITLAFAPYGSDLPRWAGLARNRGHEIILQLPMEPFNYPAANPGPDSLLTSSTTDENLKRLKTFMGLFTGYVAAANFMGAKFSGDIPSLGPVLAELKHRGVYYLDDGSTGRTKAPAIGKQFGLPVRKADLVIDEAAGSQNVRAALRRLEALSLQRGWAIGTGTALPTTVNEIIKWEETLKKRGIGLVPVTALY